MLPLVRKPTRWQKKQLTANHTTDAVVIPELSYTLEVGKTYRIYGQFLHECQPGDNYVILQFKDGSEEISRADIRHADTATAGGGVHSACIIHKMTTTDLTFYVDSLTGSFITGSATIPYTYVTVEELPEHEEVSIW